MKMLIRNRLISLAAACSLAGILTGCGSTPPVIPQKKAEPFSLVPLNFLRTGQAAGVVASSSRILVIASAGDDTWTAYDLPSLARRSNGRLAAIRALAIHPAGGSFLALSDGGLVSLVSLADGRQAPLVGATLPAGRLLAAAIASDASRAIARPPWGPARLFDLATTSATPLELAGPDVRFVSISSDGSILSGPRGSGTAMLRTPTGQLSTIPVSGNVISAAWHQDYAACGTLFWEFRVWPRSATGKAIVRTIDHTPVSALAFGDIGGRVFLFAGSGRIGGGRIRVWELPQCRSELASLNPECGEIIHLAVHGTTLTAVSADGMATLWAIHPGTQQSTEARSSNTHAPARPGMQGLR